MSSSAAEGIRGYVDFCWRETLGTFTANRAASRIDSSWNSHHCNSSYTSGSLISHQDFSSTDLSLFWIHLCCLTISIWCPQLLCHPQAFLFVWSVSKSWIPKLIDTGVSEWSHQQLSRQDQTWLSSPSMAICNVHICLHPHHFSLKWWVRLPYVQEFEASLPPPWHWAILMPQK